MKPPAITVHDHEQARAAFAAAAATGRPFCLLSPPGAGGYLGVGWLPALAAGLRKDFPQVAARTMLDCAGDAGYAMAAIRQQAADALVFTGSPEDLRRLGEIASEAGIEVLDERPESLDLAAEEAAEDACRGWLESAGAKPRAGD